MTLARQLRDLADERVIVVVEPEGPRAAPEWVDTVTAAKRLGMSRSTLDDMVGRAPHDLPGAPVIHGTGARRRRRRWDANRLDEWLAAYSRWVATQATHAAPKPRALPSSSFEPSAPRARSEGPRGAAGPKNKRRSLLSLVNDGER